MQEDAMILLEKTELFLIKKENEGKVRDYITSQEEKGWVLMHERIFYDTLGLHVELKFGSRGRVAIQPRVFFVVSVNDRSSEIRTPSNFFLKIVEN